MKRNLCGVYFKMGDENICFSDMTPAQQDEIMLGRDAEWLKMLCKILASTIRKIGDELDINVDKTCISFSGE